MFRSIRRIVCGISGGVDSAVSALILKQKGYEIIGVFMKNWDKTDEIGECQADKDFVDAQFVCDHLNIPLHQVNFVKDYWNEVFSQFIMDHQDGISSVPDIFCNRYIKFDLFFDVALNTFQADAIATGHYAKTSIEQDLENVDLTKGVKLLRGRDRVKDQTFFLSQVPQKALERTMFPLGNLLKSDVKRIAKEAGLERIANKKESMGICFIGKTNFQKFIGNYIESKPGDFLLLETNEIVGTHQGLHHWTIGQRARLPGASEMYFIQSKDLVSNNITVVKGTDHPGLFCWSAITHEPYWIHEPPHGLYQGQSCVVGFKYQHLHPVSKCTISLNERNGLTATVDEPMRAFTPGQFLVFYSGEECLGSARVQRTGPSLYELNHRTRVKLRKEFT